MEIVTSPIGATRSISASPRWAVLCRASRNGSPRSGNAQAPARGRSRRDPPQGPRDERLHKDPQRTQMAFTRTASSEPAISASSMRMDCIFRGRLKEMIKSGGINVSPAEIEDILSSHLAIEAAYVVGIPDAEKDGQWSGGHWRKTWDRDQLKAFCRERLAACRTAQVLFRLGEGLAAYDHGQAAARSPRRTFPITDMNDRAKRWLDQTPVRDSGPLSGVAMVVVAAILTFGIHRNSGKAVCGRTNE